MCADLLLGGCVFAKVALHIASLKSVLSHEVLIEVVGLVVVWGADTERPDNGVADYILLVEKAGVA